MFKTEKTLSVLFLCLAIFSFSGCGDSGNATATQQKESKVEQKAPAPTTQQDKKASPNKYSNEFYEITFPAGYIQQQGNTVAQKQRGSMVKDSLDNTILAISPDGNHTFVITHKVADFPDFTSFSDAELLQAYQYTQELYNQTYNKNASLDDVYIIKIDNKKSVMRKYVDVSDTYIVRSYSLISNGTHFNIHDNRTPAKEKQLEVLSQGVLSSFKMKK